MIGHILRHKNYPVYRLIEGKIDGKRDQRHPRTSTVE
jgi:hypothetical protein